MELTPVVARSHTSLCTDATVLAAHPADVENEKWLKNTLSGLQSEIKVGSILNNGEYGPRIMIVISVAVGHHSRTKRVFMKVANAKLLCLLKLENPSLSTQDGRVKAGFMISGKYLLIYRLDRQSSCWN
jgi:hypothetical protein